MSVKHCPEGRLGCSDSSNGKQHDDAVSLSSMQSTVNVSNGASLNTDWYDLIEHDNNSIRIHDSSINNLNNSCDAENVNVNKQREFLTSNISSQYSNSTSFPPIQYDQKSPYLPTSEFSNEQDDCQTTESNLNNTNHSFGSKRKARKSGRPIGSKAAIGPSLTVAASTNAGKRLKIKNLFRKVASLDLCTDVVNHNSGDPETKFVLVQVSSAPTPPVEGGGAPRLVTAEKVKTVTIYGGPNPDDLLRTMSEATSALKERKGKEFKLNTLHNIDDVDEHFTLLESQRKLTPRQLKNRRGDKL